MSKVNDLGPLFFQDRKVETYNLLHKEIKYIVSMLINKRIYRDSDRKLIIDKTLEDCFTKIDLFNPDYKFSTFIWMRTQNNVRSYYKSFNTLRMVYNDELVFWATENEDTEKIDKYNMFRMIIDRVKLLPEPERTWIIEKYVYGKELKELAKEYNVPLSKVKNRIYFNLNKIKIEFNNEID